MALLGIIGRERALVNKLAKTLNAACRGHEVTKVSETARGATFRVNLFDGPEPAGRIALVTVEMEPFTEALVGASEGRKDLVMETQTEQQAPAVIDGGRSHWLEFPTDRRPTVAQPFKREEVHPVVRVSVPRVGTVRAQFSCDRYESSVWDEGGRESHRVMGKWRVILRSVHVDVDEVFPPEASGVGPVARDAIRAQGEPLVVAWLDGDGYKSSRRRAAAYAYRLLLKEEAGRGSSAMYRAREALGAIADELAPMELASLEEATEKIAAGLEIMDREPVG